MKGRRLAALLGAGVIAGLLVAPASAEVTIPEVVSITDPAGDANYLNDQGGGATVNGNPVIPDSDNTTTPVDAGNASDILKVWFSNEAETVSAHFQTELPPPATQGLVYRIQATPGQGSVGSSAVGCLWFEAYIAGVQSNTGQKTTYQGSSFGRLRDVCNLGSAVSTTIPGEYTIETLENGTGVTTITVPREGTPLLANGETIKAPYMEVRNLFGAEAPSPVGTNTVTAPVIDTTDPGLDFVLDVGGGGKVPCGNLQKPGDNLILGTPEADELHGTAGRDIICGLKGNDTINGYDDKDLILGGAGVDVIYGNDGNDDLRGSVENDVLDGGTGVDRLKGGADDDSLNGGAGSDRLNAGAGKDVCRSGGGKHEVRKGCEK